MLGFTKEPNARLFSEAYTRVVYSSRVGTWVGNPRDQRNKNGSQREVQYQKMRNTGNIRGTRGKTQEHENTEKHKEIALSNTKTS